jgi:hypothetical protein
MTAIPHDPRVPLKQAAVSVRIVVQRREAQQANHPPELTLMSRTRYLILTVVAVLMLQLPFSTSVAHATTASDAQNPELTVSLSVPDQASVGDIVAASISIANNSPRLQMIVVKGIWMDPAGETTVQSKNGLLLPGQTLTRVVDYKLDERSIPGTHQITLTVETRGGASSATAAVEVI